MSSRKKSKRSSTGSKSKAKRFWPYGVGIFALLLFIDQYTKTHIVANYSLGESHKMLPWLWFTYVQNTGTLWGLLQNANWAFMYLSIIAFGLLLYFYDQFNTITEKIAYTLILAGLWGNLIDRTLYGFVVDFIDLGWWPVFNIADSCIVVAIVLLLLDQFRKS